MSELPRATNPIADGKLPWAVLAVAVVALLRFLPALSDAHWLSDDYALATLLQRDVEPPALDWSEVARQFHDKWLFSQAYWRPLVPLSYAVNQAVTGFSAWSFGFGNLLMHVVASYLAALLCARLTRGAALAALLGGVFFALHPLAVEPVLWISARVSTLEVPLRLGTMLAFAGYLRDGRRVAMWATVLLAIAALMTKESAIALPIDLLAVDLCVRERQPLRQRLRLHLRLLPIWIGYFVVRWLLLRSLAAEQLVVPGLGGILSIGFDKLATIFVPVGGPWIAIAWAAVIVVGVGSAIRGRRKAPLAAFRLDAAVLGLALLGVVLPTFNFAMRPELVGSRLLYGVLPMLAVVLLRQLTAPRPDPTLRFMTIVGMGALVAANWPVTSMQIDRYRSAERAMAGLTHELARPLVAVDLQHPLAVLSVPSWPGIPGIVNPATVFALGEPPFGERVIPILSLTALLEAQPYTRDDDPATPDLFGDPSPVHALIDAGSPVAYWNQSAQRLDWVVRTALPDQMLRPGPDGNITFPQRLDALTFELLEVRTDVETGSGSIAWLTERGRYDGVVELGFVGGEERDGERVFQVDASRHAPLLVAQNSGVGLLGLSIHLDRGALRGVRLMPRVPELETGLSLDGTTIGLDELEIRLRFAAVDAGIERDVMLFTPTAVHCLRVESDGRVEVSVATRELLGVFARHLRGDVVHFVLRRGGVMGTAPSSRSRPDWFRLRKD